ncbi:MAG: 16S rRNA (cytidine(1402)-2'-O)-methyltransferase [Pseudomonadota bacterium]
MSMQLDTGTLYVVATPIGHLGDLTRRAEDVLKSASIVVAEDTRRTQVLLEHIGHRAPDLVSLHEHNEEARSGELIQRLRDGSDIALVSDAGTPLVNDPGFPLLRMAHAAGLTTVPVPGCCAITTLLSVCPIPTQPFRFVGFLPVKQAARRKLLQGWLAQADAVVFLESPKRIRRALQDVAQLTQRQIFVGRELTKRHESFYTGTASQVLEQLPETPRGELIGVIEAGQVEARNPEEERLMRVLLEELAPAQAARIAANLLARKKSQMYDLALQLSRQ